MSSLAGVGGIDVPLRLGLVWPGDQPSQGPTPLGVLFRKSYGERLDIYFPRSQFDAGPVCPGGRRAGLLLPG